MLLQQTAHKNRILNNWNRIRRKKIGGREIEKEREKKIREMKTLEL